MLRIENVSKKFGGLKALEKVSLTVEKRKITSLIGPNGAGKTTLFNLITGALAVDEGKIIFAQEDITNLKSYEVCRKGIARTYQQKNLFPNLTVFDNVAAGMFKNIISEKERKDRVNEILEFLHLIDRSSEIVSGLPPLEAKLVELGRALATDPRLILLDELVGGLLPSETDNICEIIESLKEKELTIFQIGHEMRPIMRTSDWIFVLAEGKKIAEGTPEEIKNNEEVHAVYLE
ncbi:MAG: ABC transporter ATP-binding protein [Candidatus Jordarchaeum sp.]|uniref:ABC transporter ATP-binding protein n=1 Tax=Candidatus Jordarchaeum sp. TaxID=2823881 RepID=UPI00404AB69F